MAAPIWRACADRLASQHRRRVLRFDVLETLEGNKAYYMVKRPGMTSLNQPSGGAATGRGVYSWNGNLYSVFGTKIYKGTTDLGVTLTTSSGLVGFSEVHPDASTQRLCITDGVKLFAINTADAVTTVTTIPANTTDLVFLDRYLFTMQTDGTIAQCDIDDPTTWDAAKLIVMQMDKGAGKGLARLGPYLIGFSDTSMQTFHDAANSSGSVLSNVPEGYQGVGCASQDTIAYDEDFVMWVSNTRNGGYGVQLMVSIGNVKEVSTPGINRLLRAEGTSISSSIGELIRIAGHRFYVLTLSSANRTVVYDLDTDMWYEWSSTGGTKFPIISYTQHNNTLVGQHPTDGRHYTLSESVYQDNSVNFTVLGRFRPISFDDEVKKFVRSAELIGDRQTSTTNVSLQYSDDDFISTSTARTLDMSQPSPRAMNLGRFSRRAWQISYAGANPLRLEALQLKVRVGTS